VHNSYYLFIGYRFWQLPSAYYPADRVFPGRPLPYYARTFDPSKVCAGNWSACGRLVCVNGRLNQRRSRPREAVHSSWPRHGPAPSLAMHGYVNADRSTAKRQPMQQKTVKFYSERLSAEPVGAMSPACVQVAHKRCYCVVVHVSTGLRRGWARPALSLSTRLLSVAVEWWERNVRSSSVAAAAAAAGCIQGAERKEMVVYVTCGRELRPLQLATVLLLLFS